ncbi:hypothetical protein ACMBCN_02800, partial [Candidatus Liberibacter asiaticus]|nr:hypothetical protein [Candidatus Liberibacter asiaticus]
VLFHVYSPKFIHVMTGKKLVPRHIFKFLQKIAAREFKIFFSTFFSLSLIFYQTLHFLFFPFLYFYFIFILFLFYFIFMLD